jgi:hypothetical protein
MYYIYHIPGVKIGCTINPKKRTKVQGFTDYEILEEHTDVHIASDREIQLQKEWGYTVDTKPYWQTIRMVTKESSSKGGKIGGKINGKKIVESGQWDLIRTFESSSKGGKIGGIIAGKIAIESGHLKKLQNANKKSVIQMDKLDNLIQEFESLTLAGNNLKLSISNISKCCKGKKKSTGGYKFKYKNN